MNSWRSSLNILVIIHPGLLLYGSPRRTLRDAFAGKNMQMHLFVFVKTAEYLHRFLLYRADIVCSQYKADPVEPCSIPLLFSGCDKNRKNAHEGTRIVDCYNINQEPVSDVDFQVQHKTVTGNIGLAIEGGKHFFRTVTTEGSLYKGYNVLLPGHRQQYIRIYTIGSLRMKGYFAEIAVTALKSMRSLLNAAISCI